MEHSVDGVKAGRRWPSAWSQCEGQPQRRHATELDPRRAALVERGRVRGWGMGQGSSVGHGSRNAKARAAVAEYLVIV